MKATGIVRRIDDLGRVVIPKEIRRTMRIRESRKIYQYTGEGQPLQVTEGIDSLLTTVAAPILAEGDLLGLVLFISSDPAAVTGDTEYKLAQTIAAFLGRHMES